MVRLDALNLGTVKRGRGRPRGTGENDELRLRKVADLLIADRTMKPMTAINRVLQAADYRYAQPASVARRVYRKFCAQRKALLGQARQRRSARMMSRERDHNRSVARAIESAIGRTDAYGRFAAIDAAQPGVTALLDTPMGDRYANTITSLVDRASAITSIVERASAAWDRADAITRLVERHAPWTGAYEQSVREATGGVLAAALERQAAITTLVERHEPSIRSYEERIGREMNAATGGALGLRRC